MTPSNMEQQQRKRLYQDFAAHAPSDARRSPYGDWEHQEASYPATASFEKFAGHTKVALPGKVSLLADIGAYNNLASSAWFESSKASASQAGRGDEICTSSLPAPLSIAGVGKGTQSCTQQMTVPGRLACGTDITFTAPCVPDSEFPGLLGLNSMDKLNAVIFCVENKIVCLPEGTAGDLLSRLPKGSKVIDCERAPSGHMMIPISNWQTSSSNVDGRNMALVSDLPAQQATQPDS